jgi:hypothetical protein
LAEIPKYNSSSILVEIHEIFVAVRIDHRLFIKGE